MNMSPALGIEILNRLLKIIKDYCGMLTEEAVRRNFSLIYELLDEAIVRLLSSPNPQDFGYPQDTSSEALVQFVHNKPVVIVDPKVRLSLPFLFPEEPDRRCEQVHSDGQGREAQDQRALRGHLRASERDAGLGRHGALAVDRRQSDDAELPERLSAGAHAALAEPAGGEGHADSGAAGRDRAHAVCGGLHHRGRYELPPVHEPGEVRKRPSAELQSAGRRVRGDELPHHHAVPRAVHDPTDGGGEERDQNRADSAGEVAVRAGRGREQCVHRDAHAARYHDVLGDAGLRRDRTVQGVSREGPSCALDDQQGHRTEGVLFEGHFQPRKAGDAVCDQGNRTHHVALGGQSET